MNVSVVTLTVIIPTKNRLVTANLLAARVKELLPEVALEVIVVTPLPTEPPTPSDDLVRYVADSGRGVYRAYNAGLRLARGEYIWFMGDDDYPLDAAGAIGEILRRGAVDVLIAPVLFSSGRIYRPTRTLLLLHFLNWCQQGVIYRRRQLSRHRFYHRLTIQADQYVNILLRADSSVSTVFLKEPICIFGVNGISGRGRDEHYRSLRTALARRSLGRLTFVAFCLLAWVEPLVKRFAKVR